MMKSLLTLPLTLGALLAMGCARHTPEASPTPGAGGKPRVALVMKSLANEFFKTMEEGARKHQGERAAEYDLVVNGIKDEQDVAGQIALVEQMIARGVDAIVLAPADSKALVSVCQRATDAGVIVINIDNRLDAGVLAERGMKIPFVGPDNRRGARLAGEHLAAKLKVGDKVAIIEGVPNAFNGVQRKAGFEDAMRAAGMNVVASQSANWETARADQIVASLVTEQPDIKAFLCANDSMALGAVAALRAAGRSKDVHVVGFDNISAVRQLIRDGQISATVEQHGDRLAVFGIEYALDVLKNKGAPQDRETPIELITAANVE